MKSMKFIFNSFKSYYIADIANPKIKPKLNLCSTYVDIYIC